MNTAKLLVTCLLLLPLPALAADDAKQDAKPATKELHGFDKYWSKMDPTGKGFVTKDEFMAHQAERFAEIDSNGDGKISREEMKAHDDKIRDHFRKIRAQHHPKDADKTPPKTN